MEIKRQEYEEFVERFASGLKESHRDTCFFVYGSYLSRERFVPGISDIDGGIILPGGVVTPKKKILNLAEIFDESLGNVDKETEFYFDFDLNLLDRTTNRDGRFLSYSVSAVDYIKQHGMVLSGPTHYVTEMQGMDYRSEDFKHAVMNLRSLRNRLLTSYYDSRIDYPAFKKRTRDSIKKAVKFSKQLVLLRSGQLLPNPHDSRKRLSEMLKDNLGEEDFELFADLEGILRNQRTLSKELNDRDKSVVLLTKALESVELIVDAYLRQFPEPELGLEFK